MREARGIRGGGVKPRRRRPRRPKPELTPAQRHQRDLHRAWACGERYARRGWRRRPPPRFRARNARDDAGVETTRAFLRGYDQQVRSMNRRRARERAEAWPESRAA